MERLQIVELIAACIGILYVVLEMRASIWLWPVGIVLPLFYIYISYQSGVYGNIIVNLYYIIACIWGWWMWLRSEQGGSSASHSTIHYSPPRERLVAAAVTLALIPIVSYLLHTYMSSKAPVWDGIATSVSLVGMWLLGKKYIENWYCWILSNAIYCYLFFAMGHPISGLFFLIYTAIAVMGLLNWKRMMRNEA